jgi:ABC-2 type transport system ATP-binding protein
VVRALDAAGLEVSNLRLDEPSLNDVFLAKKGRSLEGAGEEAQT